MHDVFFLFKCDCRSFDEILLNEMVEFNLVDLSMQYLLWLKQAQAHQPDAKSLFFFWIFLSVCMLVWYFQPALC